MSTFLSSKNYSTDCCAKESKDTQNSKIADWVLHSTILQECETPKMRSPEFQYDHINLRARIGYGVSGGCEIDVDSRLRNNPEGMTTDKCKVQLYKRIFQGCPNLKPVIDDPGKELSMIEGVSTTCDPSYKYKKHLMEVDFSHQTPLIECMKQVQHVDNIVEGWTRGGESTRDFVRRQECLKQ